MDGGTGPYGSGNRNAAKQAHEYQVYKSITEKTASGGGKAHSGSDSGIGCGALSVLAVIAGIVSATNPVVEGFLFWGILLFLFLRFTFS